MSYKEGPELLVLLPLTPISILPKKFGDLLERHIIAVESQAFAGNSHNTMTSAG